MKKLILALTIAAMGMFYSATAEAVFTQTTTGTMNIAATVLATCSLSTTPINFPAYDGTASVSSTSTITVNCSSGQAYRIDIDAGINSISTIRYLKTGTAPATITNTRNYDLFKAPSMLNTDVWGDNGNTYCVGCTVTSTGLSATGTGVNQIHTVYGILYRSLTPPLPGLLL